MNTENKTPILGPEELDALREQIKSQVLEEMKNEEVRRHEETIIRQREEKEEHARYVEKMKQSPDPWVDIIGLNQTSDGMKIELEWNDAFISFLRSNNVSGSDEDQVVQKWLTLLLHDMTSQLGDNTEIGTSSEYE